MVSPYQRILFLIFICLQSLNLIYMDDPQRNIISSISHQLIAGRNHQTLVKDYKRKVYDNIHGFIYFRKLIWDFIDTPHFQRLRKIKQLSTQQFVTPGATHTRFEHCIGTAHLARKFIETLIENHPEEYRGVDKQRAVLTMTIAGLLHDIGHGPYSHAFDDEVVTQIYVPGQEKPRKWSHELASQLLFQNMTELPQIKGHLSPVEIARVKALIRGEPDGVRVWEFQLISNKINGIDVDKLDYFRRDAFYLGAKNIYIDHQLLISEARIVNGQLCYPTKYVETVYNIFHSRYKLYKQYYFNVICKAVQMMICDILRLTRQHFQLRQACQQLYINQPHRYLRLNDSVIEKVQDVYQRILAGEKKTIYKEQFRQAVNLLERIRQRKLYKFVRELTYYLRQKDYMQVINIFEQHFRKQKIQEKLKQIAGLTSQHICVTVSDVGFGLKDANPLKRVGFFKKQEEKVFSRRRLGPAQVQALSMLYTDAYIERSIKVFIKEDSPELFFRTNEAVDKFRSIYQEVIKFDTGKGGKTPAKLAIQQIIQPMHAEYPHFLS